MRYPVGIGTREDFENNWYNAQGFGNQTSYGWHEGCDYNLKTGGDTDIGQPLYAIADGTVKYYHQNSHPTTGFGIHVVVEHDTPFGKRWCHYAHCQVKNFTSEVTEVKEGDKIAEVGKSGTRYGHLHFSVFTIDPGTLPNGIDSYAKTKTELNKNWIDPTEFLNLWYGVLVTGLKPVDVETIINDTYLALTGDKPSDSEVKWRLDTWTDTKDLIESVTADSRFYELYIQPQLDKQKEQLETACNTAKDELNADWQTKMDTAKTECEARLKECEDKKFEDFAWYELVEAGFKKMIGGWR